MFALCTLETNCERITREVITWKSKNVPCLKIYELRQKKKKRQKDNRDWSCEREIFGKVIVVFRLGFVVAAKSGNILRWIQGKSGEVTNV